MTAFRIHLVVLVALVAAYTLAVMATHGANLFPAFFGAIREVDWQGQFNLDFLCMLTLSGLFVARRHRFSPLGCALGLAAFFGGVLFLGPYLLVASVRARGDVATLLLGEASRAS